MDCSVGWPFHLSIGLRIYDMHVPTEYFYFPIGMTTRQEVAEQNRAAGSSPRVRSLSTIEMQRSCFLEPIVLTIAKRGCCWTSDLY